MHITTWVNPLNIVLNESSTKRLHKRMYLVLLHHSIYIKYSKQVKPQKVVWWLPRAGFCFMVMKMSEISLWWWLHNSINLLKIIELYTLNSELYDMEIISLLYTFMKLLKIFKRLKSLESEYPVSNPGTSTWSCDVRASSPTSLFIFILLMMTIPTLKLGCEDKVRGARNSLWKIARTQEVSVILWAYPLQFYKSHWAHFFLFLEVLYSYFTSKPILSSSYFSSVFDSFF